MRHQGILDKPMPPRRRHHIRFCAKRGGAIIGLLLVCLFAVAGCVKQVDPPNPEKMYQIVLRPEGPGPHPGMVLLHGCGGWGGLEIGWAKQLKEWGYVAILVDSFGPRNVRIKCGSENNGPGKYDDRVEDAYGALLRLQSMPDVDPARIGVIGWSHGGGTTLRVIQDAWRSRYELTENQRFAAAVAFYPWCDTDWRSFNAPLLIQVGGADDWTPASQCSSLVAGGSTPEGAPEIDVYPGAYHSFDDRDAVGGFRGHKRAYDPEADEKARARVKAYLAEHL